MDQPLPRHPYQLQMIEIMHALWLTVTDIRLVEEMENLTFVDTITTTFPRRYLVQINSNWDLHEVVAWLKTYLDAKADKLVKG